MQHSHRSLSLLYGLEQAKHLVYQLTSMMSVRQMVAADLTALVVLCQASFDPFADRKTGWESHFDSDTKGSNEA